MERSVGEVSETSKVCQALSHMQSALNLLDEVESASPAAAHLDMAISVLKREIDRSPGNPGH